MQNRTAKNGEPRAQRVTIVGTDQPTRTSRVSGSYRTSFALNELASPVQQARAVDDAALEDRVINAMTKSVQILVGSLDETSSVDLAYRMGETRQLDEANRDDRKESRSSAVDGPLKGEEMIRLKRRGSVFPLRRSTVHPLSIVASSMSTSWHDARRKEESDATSVRTVSRIGTTSTLETVTVDTRTMLLDTPPPPGLSRVEAAAIHCVLRECLEQLNVARYAIPAEVDEGWEHETEPIDEKYGVPDEPKYIFREDMGLPRLIPTAAEKIQKERHYACEILATLAESVKRDGSYDELEREVDRIAKAQEDERDLEANSRLWTSQVAQLRQLLRNESEASDGERKRIRGMAQSANAHVDTAIFLNGSRLGYAEKWENSRLEQQTARVAARERELSDQLAECEKMQRADRIISREVCAYLEENIGDLEAEIVAWTGRYNEEIFQKQQDVDELKERVEEQKLELQDMYALRDEYRAIIEQRNAEAERLRLEAEHRARINGAATVIQTFWRGYMVRRQLGEYENLWARLKKRKRLAAKARKKREAWQRKKAEQWAKTGLKKLKHTVDPNA